MLTIECPGCGQLNKIELANLATAACHSCDARLVEETIPQSITEGEIVSTVEDSTKRANLSEVEVTKWIAKIGNHEEQSNYVKNGFWSKVKKYAAKVTFAHNAVAMYYCALDPATPFAAKAKAIGALAYWILPIDLIPDFIPVAGFADDATAILLAYNAMSSQITDEHRRKAEEFFAQ